MSKDTNKFYIARARAQSLINTIDDFEKAGLTEVEEEKVVYELEITDVINACDELDSMLRDELSYAAEDSDED